MIEYGDYACPHCARAFHVVRRPRSVLNDDLRVVFRNFPLTVIHLRAVDAALVLSANFRTGLGY